MATYGKIVESKESEESWAQYIERLEQYFRGNDIEDAGKKASESTSASETRGDNHFLKDRRNSRKAPFTQTKRDGGAF